LVSERSTKGPSLKALPKKGTRKIVEKSGEETIHVPLESCPSPGSSK
jgi:hypothetical protein